MRLNVTATPLFAGQPMPHLRETRQADEDNFNELAFTAGLAVTAIAYKIRNDGGTLASKAWSITLTVETFE